MKSILVPSSPPPAAALSWPSLLAFGSLLLVVGLGIGMAISKKAERPPAERGPLSADAAAGLMRAIGVKSGGSPFNVRWLDDPDVQRDVDEFLSMKRQLLDWVHAGAALAAQGSPADRDWIHSQEMVCLRMVTALAEILAEVDRLHMAEQQRAAQGH